jgi:hypothetical protein
MKSFYSVISHGIVVCLVSVLSASANPNPPDAYPVLSEIQVTDSLHWNVEVDVSVYPLFNYPCTTDTMLLFCRQDTSTPPDAAMRKPVISEVFDSKGIGVLTPLHFPGLKLVKGATVFLQYRYTTTYGTYQVTWKALIPSNITPAQSVAGSIEMYCCDIFHGMCDMYCPRTVYSISNKPTIGLPNSYAGISSHKSVAFTAGRVRLLSPKIRGQIPMAVSGNFSGKGMIDIFAADGSLVRSLSFACNGQGTYTILWDGNNKQGRTVPAGTYICRVKLGEDVSCKGFIVW